jgi:hypothetical protein
LVDNAPLIIGSHGWKGVAAYRWKCQVNENSKSPAFWNVFPELNHNETVGWEAPLQVLQRLHVVVLRDPKDSLRVARRVDVTKDIISDTAGGVTEFWAEAESAVARLFSLIYPGDFTSAYLALAYGIDPTPVKAIDRLKNELQNKQGAEHVFVMGHSPAFTPDTTASTKIAQFNLFDQISLRDQFWKLLTDNHVTAYVSGHEHLYFRGKVAGLPQIVIGNLGCNSSYNPATVDSRMTSVFPTVPVPQAACRPGYSIFTVDGSKNSIAATVYWLDDKNNKYVYDTYVLS